MSTKLCKRCQSAEVFGRKLYCPDCKEIVEDEKRQKKKKRDWERYKRKIGGMYKYNKNHGIEQPKEEETHKPLSAAAQRWAKMSWYDICKELDYYKLKYRDAQMLATNDMLPEDWGMHR